MSSRAAAGSKRTTRSQATHSRIPLRSPLKAAARVRPSKDENTSSASAAATSRKRPREVSTTSSVSNKKPRQDDTASDVQEPLSPRNTNTPELEHDPMQVDGSDDAEPSGSAAGPPPPSDHAANIPVTPTKPSTKTYQANAGTKLFATGKSPIRSPGFRTPGQRSPGLLSTATRLPRPFFKSSALPSASGLRVSQKPAFGNSRPLASGKLLFNKASVGSTPAKTRGPVTRAANVKRFMQPATKRVAPTVAKPAPLVIGSPSKKTGIFKAATSAAVPEETARETQNSLSVLENALKRLAAPRPAPRRPASSLGFNADGDSSADTSRTEDQAPEASRPGTSMSFFSPTKSRLPRPTKLDTIPGSPVRPPQQTRTVSSPFASTSSSAPTNIPRMGPPTTPGNRNVKTFSGLPVPATGTRHASLANRNLTRTLSEIAAAAPVKLVSGDLSGSSEAAKKEKLRVQPTRAPSSRIAAQRHVDSPESAGNASSRSALPTSSSSKPKPPKDTAPTLDVLKHCTVFVDVRTAEGDDDAADLFVEMLRGLGARILTRMSTRLTHIIFKSGLPSTVAKYRMLREPRPAVVGIGWVVECAEKRERVDESRFAVDLDTADTKQKRRTDGPLNPVPHRRLYTGDGPEGEDEDDESLNNNGFTAEEESFLEFEFEKSIVGVNLPPNGNTNGNSRKSVGGKRKSVVPSPKVKNVLSMSDVAVSESRPTTTQKEIADFFTTKRRVASSGHRPRFGSPLREFSLPPDEDEELATTSAEPVPDADAMEL